MKPHSFCAGMNNGQKPLQESHLGWVTLVRSSSVSFLKAGRSILDIWFPPKHEGILQCVKFEVTHLNMYFFWESLAYGLTKLLIISIYVCL